MELSGRMTVKVKPGALTNEIVSYSEGVLQVKLKAKPQDNKANIALVKFLKKELGKPVRIVSGLTSKKKIVEFY